MQTIVTNEKGPTNQQSRSLRSGSLRRYLKKYENEIQTINSITTEKIMASR